MCHHESRTLLPAACPASSKSITQPAAAGHGITCGAIVGSVEILNYSSRAARQPQPSHLCGVKAPLVMSFVLSCKVATDTQVQFTVKCDRTAIQDPSAYLVLALIEVCHTSTSMGF
jgi:hypothetical protein